MRIGYSFWGFLGNGVTDTPDGGRSHRRVLIDGLVDRGHSIVFLQPNRDHIEAGENFTGAYTWHDGLPRIDALILEWRWPVPGRNTTPCPTPMHACDLHRQTDLVDAYVHRLGLPTLLWDKDLRLPTTDPLRTHHAVTVCEASLFPSRGARRLLFPVQDSALDTADPERLAQIHRDLPLVYTGNQYDRDDAFTRFFAPAAQRYRHLVAGKWTRTGAWPHVTFAGRRPFTEVEALHRRSLATVLLAPDRYRTQGQFTQRLFEAVLAGCLPIGPADIRGVEQVLPADLIVTNGAEVTRLIGHLTQIAGTDRHSRLIAACLERLEPFRLSRQTPVIESRLALTNTHREGARG
ncbi:MULTISPECIES: hypothetical protein [Nocardiopsis]|uniref:Glycosyltransferase n=1 Tax=Nocardiopsis akebiae TaxID=2831968 RepID=A0ABX8CC42_9ACTN|nr:MULTISPECIES: hypothetical protein [Nocardiopsis]QUX30621.1 hypothetical protein KGD83_08995 [Nocardiopsis akebiae]WDZ92814.1 hypothetical protein PV789_09920 [Nocardiopsis sp. HUAS JQ3]